MYDIFYINQNPQNNSEYNKLKSKFPMLKASKDFATAQKQSLTEFFWIIWDDLMIEDSFEFDYVPKEWNKEYIHSFLNGNTYDGVVLVPKNALITKKETEYRFFVKKIDVAVCASTPKQYDTFIIDTYDEYLHACENSTTELFWAISRNLKISENFDFSLYFSYDNMYDRHENHAFIHAVNGEELYNGVFLLSKKNKLSKREIEFRFPVNRKEWPIVASCPIEYEKFNIDTYDDYLEALSNSKTEMFWAISSDDNINDCFDFTLYFIHNNEYDRNQNHEFVHRINDGDYYTGIFLFSKHKPVSEKEIKYKHLVERKIWSIAASGPIKYEKFNVATYDDYLEALDKSKTEMFWIIPNYVTIDLSANFDVCFTHDQTFERTINHVFLNGKYYDGVTLCSKYSKFSKREFDYKFIAKKVETPVIMSSPNPYDVIFISYKEPNADENYARLLSKRADAKRVHGIDGIHNAHIEAAKLAETDMFWIVDGDALIEDDFNFDYQSPRWDKDVVHVWRSKNPINNLTYGYGGVKLFPRKLTIDMDTTLPDMTTSISKNFKPMNQVSNTTQFNTSPFDAWKSAFRECVKLSSKVISRQKEDETAQRLEIWCTLGVDRPFGKFAIEGAINGKEYGLENKNNIEALKLINDFKWLQERFNEQHS